MSITYDGNFLKEINIFLKKIYLYLLEIDFDEEKWEDMINSDEILKEEFLKSIDTMDNSNNIFQNKDIVKLSFNDFTRSTFFNTNQCLRIGRSMTILISPSSYQRVRYENECKHIYRYISVPNNRTLTIEVDKTFLFV
jgi:hypothetical protein